MIADTCCECGRTIPRAAIGMSICPECHAGAAFLYAPSGTTAGPASPGVTTLLRNDGVLLGQMLIEVFGPGAYLPYTPELVQEELEEKYPDVKFVPTDECWQEAVRLFETHLNDEADELVESLDEGMEEHGS